EPEILKLHKSDDWVIVVGLQKVHVGWADARLRIEIIPVHLPTAAHLDGILRERVVSLDGAQDARERKAAPLGLVFAHDQESLRSGTGHDAVEEPKRVSDEATTEIGFKRQWLPEQGIRRGEGACALGNAELPEIRRSSAVNTHIVGCQE